jgi:AraC-like DNA-binding protein
MIFLYPLTLIQSLFLVALLLSKKNISLSDRVLVIWLSGIASHALACLLVHQFQVMVPLHVNLNVAFQFVQGPLLLAYIAALNGKREKFSRLDYLHLLPVAAFITHIAVLYGRGVFALSVHNDAQFVSLFDVHAVFNAVLLISVPVYIFLSLDLLRKARQCLGSAMTPAYSRWIAAVIACLGMIWISFVADYFDILRGLFNRPGDIVYLSLALSVYVLGYLGLRRAPVFSLAELETIRCRAQRKYRKSGLSPDDARIAHKRLIEFVQHKQIHLDSTVSLQSLARELGLSTNHLSQIINEFEQCNFYDFINKRRVKESCARLEQPIRSSLLDLALLVVFRSKSSFNRAFQKFTGSSPSEYARKHHDYA